MTAPVSIKDLPDLLTVREAAQFMRISSLTLKRWEKKGTIVPIRINKRGDRRYYKKQILSYLNLPDENN